MNSNVVLSTNDSARHRLRRETRDDHDAVDGVYSRFDLGLESGYRRFLRAHARRLADLEAALDARASAMLEDWPRRRRATLLAADLDDLGESFAADGTEAPKVEFGCDAAALGGLYVLEGSRLGGAVLLRGVYRGAPQRFLSPPAAGGSWRALVDLIDRKLGRETDIVTAVEAAKTVFKCFETAGREELERPLGD